MRLRAEITIQHEPRSIWEILVDVGHYREWNPFLCEVRGEVRVGGMLELSLGGSDGYDSRERAVVTRVEAERELRFLTVWLRAGLIDTDHRIELVGGSEGTRVVATTDVTGWLQNYTSSRRLTTIARGWVGMNEALKRRLERKR
ncbi:MAG: hypothetical protein JW751_16985 [Polyangiaceae bacterium]|nr:hypothetical protein [Polyangiaceae bacterium]